MSICVCVYIYTHIYIYPGIEFFLRLELGEEFVWGAQECFRSSMLFCTTPRLPTPVFVDFFQYRCRYVNLIVSGELGSIS